MWVTTVSSEDEKPYRLGIPNMGMLFFVPGNLGGITV